MRIDNAGLQTFLEEVRARFGLVFESSRHDELRELIRERALALRCVNVADFLTSLKSSESEWQEIANRLTVPETYFFRIPEHFHALAAAAVPERMKIRGGERVLRCASLGCASGEEPYTIAMVLRSQFEELASWRLEIKAFDVSATSIERAARGIYSDWSLRAISEEMRGRFFTRTKRGWELDRDIRSMVSFHARNILDVCTEPQGSYDVVFLRNVLIYFSSESMRAAVECAASMLAPGGFLFLGTAETLRGLSNAFSLCHSHGAFYYRRVDGKSAPQPMQQRAPARKAPTPDIQIDIERIEYDTANLAQTVTWLEHIRDASDRVAKLTTAKPVQSQRKVTRDAAIQAAMSIFATEKYAAALAELDLLGAEEREDADVQVLRAVLLTNAQNVKAAQRAASAALELDHLHAGAHYVLALCAEHDGELALALEHDLMAAYLDPAFAMPHMHAAAIHRRRGEIDKACSEVERARSLLGGEDAGRILLFGGGFSREALVAFCERQILSCRGGR